MIEQQPEQREEKFDEGKRERESTPNPVVDISTWTPKCGSEFLDSIWQSLENAPGDRTLALMYVATGNLESLLVLPHA